MVETAVGLRVPTRGTVSVLGLDPAWRGEAFERVALQPQRAALFPELTVAETLALWASLYAEPASEEAVIEDVALTDRRHVRAGTLSGGQQQRLLLGMTLIADPELLILDEPTGSIPRRAGRSGIPSAGNARRGAPSYSTPTTWTR